MGTVRFVDTRSSGDSYSTIEYEFESYADFKDYLESQRQAAAAVVNSMMFGSNTEDYGAEPSAVVETTVKKKTPTKH